MEGSTVWSSKSRLTLAALLFASTAAAQAATFYVSTQGNDAADGLSTTTAWRTLQHAADNVNAGDVVEVLAGAYSGFTAENRFGTASQWITMRPYQGQRVTINPPNGRFNIAAIWFNPAGCDPDFPSTCPPMYWTVEGFEITGIGATNYVVKLDAGSVKLRNNDIHSGATDIIKLVRTADNVEITDNVIHFSNAVGATGYVNAQGIDLVGTADTVIARNHIFDIYDHAIVPKGQALRTIIEDNRIEKYGQRAIALGGMTDDDVFRTPNRWNFDANGNPTSPKPGVPARYETEGAIVRNNVINGADGASGCVIVSSAYDASIYNNSCYMAANTRHGSIFMNSDESIDLLPNRNIDIRNNILHGTGAAAAILVNPDSTDLDTLQLDNNVYWAANGPVVFDGFGIRGDITAWRNRTQRDFASIVADPQFTHPTFLTIAGTSPAVDSGQNTPAGQTKPCAPRDRTGDVRPQDGNNDGSAICDIGADELVGSGPQLQPPVAQASATPTSGNAPLTVQFSGSGSSDPDGTVTTYEWNFGDNTTGSGVNVSHTYSATGTYVAVLTVTDNSGLTDTDQVTISVGVDSAPTAAMTATPTSGTAPLTVNFDGSGSSDPEGPIASYAWAFGDGATATGVTTSHIYNAAGTYTATLTVTDSSGQTNSAQSVITVSGSSGETTTRWENNDTRLSYTPVGTGAWSLNGSQAAASGGNYAVGNGAGAVVEFSFTGTGVKWISALDQYSGQATVTIDGVSETVDLYRSSSAPDFGWQQIAWQKSGLANTTHTVRIEVLGTKNAASGGVEVMVDAFDILP